MINGMKQGWLIILLFINATTTAQVNLDSLRRSLTQENDPTKKAATLILLCEQFRFTNLDSLKGVSTELTEFGKRSKNDVWQINGELYIATYHNLTGDPDTALLIAQRNLQRLINQHEEETLLPKFYSLAGNSLMRLNRQKDALQMFYNCLQLAEGSKDRETQFKAQNNIGWAYMELEQFEPAIKSFRDCLATIHRFNLPDRHGTIYNNLASCYGSIGAYDSVYKYASAGIRIARQYNDYAAQANGNSIIGTFLVKQNKFEQALESFEKAVAIREKIGILFLLFLILPKFLNCNPGREILRMV